MRSAAALCLAVSMLPADLAGQAAPAAPGAPKVTGFVQGRFQSIGDSALFLLRRARLGVQGNLTPWASYKLQGELRSGGTGATAATVSATDLYVAFAHREWSGSVGQFKTPWSREFLMSGTVVELADRALAVDALAPNRDVGVMVQWERRRRVTVQGGVFNGDGINRARNADNRVLHVGRLVVSVTTALDLGGAVAAGADSTGWSAEFGARRGGLTLRAEYLQRHRNAPRDDARGWYALAAYRLWQSEVQLVGRVEQFDRSSAAGDRTSGFTGGFQYFVRGDDLKLLGSYGAFTEQSTSVANNRLIVQLQARF